ncbi:MAG: hypothetical protein HYU39_01785 [Thaumarchaeota archaeon]|nr:hypothetical protein [Nitrososphaerota archaeon]
MDETYIRGALTPIVFVVLSSTGYTADQMEESLEALGFRRKVGFPSPTDKEGWKIDYERPGDPGYIIAVQSWTYGVAVVINRKDYDPKHYKATLGTIKLEQVGRMVREYLAERHERIQ